ncbi:hypothetical protein ALC57_12104 [Trachymyrmex cornetzi]|uniref:DNA-directed DNA polymerase n=1 Tax=Trachymyrmex cornetzi TaxID=471704 RepID=A0A151J1K6_9HYME|nr:hypothetical protein ALC57_12104 [Trachymyrmex cornetzi]
MESDLIEEAVQLNTRKEYVAWEQRCDELIQFIEEQSRTKRPRLAVGHRQSVVTRIARLESLKDSVRGRFVHVGVGYGLRWREIETTFESRIVTGAVINSNHIEPRRFLEDAGDVVLERLRDAVERHGSVKVNTAFNGEFATKDKRANKSINTKNSEIYRCTDVCEWYERHVVEPVLTSLEELQERDSHFTWIKDLSRLVRSQLTGKKVKKYFCDRNRVKLRFTGSFKFLNASLEKLASYLDKDKLKIVQSEFSILSDEEFELLTRKGIFPYEYVDCVDKLPDTRLQPRELFYSSLTGDTVSESDYAHALNVWKRFSIRTLGEYSDLYLKTDVLLLADIFENFRNSCVASYDLDPAHYYTLPGFTWDAMLKHTRVRFELLTDIDMTMFIERGIRGGLSQCSGRYAQANNKYMRSYDPLKPSSYLMSYDVNNLYGWVMCHLCRTPNFDGSKTLRTLTRARSLRIRLPVIFSRSISSIRNSCTTDTLTYRSAQRAISRPASVRINF